MVEDAPLIARLLHDFNTEYEEETPEVEELTRHATRMLREGEMTVLLAPDGAGLALLRFRPSVWTDVAARALYEKLGFTNREGGPEGPPMLYYEREL